MGIGTAAFICLLFLAGYRQVDKDQKAFLLGLAFGTIAGALPSFFVNLLSADASKATQDQATQDAINRMYAAYDARIDESRNESIIHLESNADCYELHGECRNIFITTRKVKFFLMPPRRLRDEIGCRDPRVEFRGPNFFGGTINEVAERTKIEDFVDLIERNKLKAAKTFLERLENSNQALYNNTKFGIFSLSFSRVGVQEKPRVNLCLYETDYYTHMVMRYAYRELAKRENNDIGKVAASDVGAEGFPYQCFLTSLGVNAFVLLENETLLVLSRRSKSGINSEADDKWHVSMNEGLSVTDDDGLGGASLESCLQRGLKEELGIFDDVKWSGKFLDFWLWRKAFEVGLSALVKIDLDRNIFQARARLALDAARERAPGTAEREFHYIRYHDAALREAKSNLDLTEAATFMLSNLIAMNCPTPF